MKHLLVLAVLLCTQVLAPFGHPHLVVLSAPAPRPRVKPVPPPPAWVGTWRMSWRGGVYLTSFRADGSYQCGNFAGTWNHDPLGNTLEVDELTEDGCHFHWTIHLRGPRTGVEYRLNADNAWEEDPWQLQAP